jgi:hypothetical protein
LRELARQTEDHVVNTRTPRRAETPRSSAHADESSQACPSSVAIVRFAVPGRSTGNLASDPRA